MVINKQTSYMIGFIQTDGHLHQGKGNKGSMTIELSIKDEDIIYKLHDLIPYYSGIYKRKRKTNINGYYYDTEFISLNVCSLEFRTFINESGVPYGKKSETIKPPTYLDNFSKIDYIRGLIDGDGSLGMTNKNIPFISFVTKSDDVANYLVNFISDITSKTTKLLNKNIRDSVYNITVMKEDAVKLCETLYYNDCLSLDRKYTIAQDIIKWVRPNNLKIAPPREKWTNEHDEFIMEHDLYESMDFLNRTEKSIKTRLYRLYKNDCI